MILMDGFIAFILGASISIAACYILVSFRKPENGKKWGSGNTKKIELQLPGFLESTASNLAAGNSLQQSIEMAISNTQEPIGTFFESILLRVKTGMTLDASLEFQARLSGNGSLRLALFSIASSYRTGGNMIESMTLLSNVCHEREILRKRILARSAQGRMQGYVLILVPLMFMLLLYFISPQNMIPVISTVTGRLLLGVAAILQCLGAVTIRAMLQQEIF